MVVAAMETDRVLVARASPAPSAGDPIPVAYPEASHLPLGNIEPGRPSLLPEGRSFVLSLEHLDRSTAPGLGPVDALREIDRSPSSDREARQRLSVPLNDLLAVVRSSTATP